MKKNVGSIDRILRIIGGLGVVAAGILLKKWWLDVIGILLLLTAQLGYCPLYVPFKINTQKTKDQ